jgi:hypothetical protein
MPVVNSYIFKQEPYTITVGDGVNDEPKYPMYPFYDYGYFAYVYLKSELNLTSTVNITGIRFQMKCSDAPQNSVNQTLKLGQVNKDEFLSDIRNDMTQSPLPTDPWVANNITTVKSNFSWSFPNNIETFQWKEVTFDTPFSYNPNDSTYPNILVIWENRDGSFLPGGLTPSAQCFTPNNPSGAAYRSYYVYQDESMPLSTGYGTRDITNTPNIQFIIN